LQTPDVPGRDRFFGNLRFRKNERMFEEDGISGGIAEASSWLICQAAGLF
jgi:hypothetical protein